MADKILVMSFLNQQGARTSLTLPGIKESLTTEDVSAAMDIIIAKNIFSTNGGNLAAKHSAQITERNVTDLGIQQN